MRKVLCSLAFTGMFLPALSQTIFIANNNPGAVPGTNVFTGTNAISDAIAAASDGDIIYVVPSGSLYGASTVNKSLTIFGGGFYPDKVTSLTSKSNNITVTADNVRISGMVIGPILHLVDAVDGVRNTMIDKCRVNRFNIGFGVGNTIIQNCVMGENTSAQYTIQSDLSNTGLRLANNLIYGTNSGGFFNLLKGAIIENNVFIGVSGFAGHDAFNILHECEIKNNIFYGLEPRGSNTGNYLNNVHHHNLSFGGTDATFINGVDGNTASNNIVGSDPMFVNLPLATGSVLYNTSNDAQLNAASPAIGAGELGVDMGAFGGTTPFDPFGTSLPLVQSITVPPTVPQGTNMDVRIQGKGN